MTALRGGESLSRKADLGVTVNAFDVIRHEFGHVLADLYPGALKKGGLFRAAFGGAYSEDPAEECVAAATRESKPWQFAVR